MGQDNQAYCPKSNPGKMQTHVEILFSTWLRPHGHTRTSENIDVYAVALSGDQQKVEVEMEPNHDKGKAKSHRKSTATMMRKVLELDQLLEQIQEKEQQVK